MDLPTQGNTTSALHICLVLLKLFSLPAAGIHPHISKRRHLAASYGKAMMNMQELLERGQVAARDNVMAKTYAERHGIRSAPNLTVKDDEFASLVVDFIAPRIQGKTVSDVGGAIGLLGLHMASVAKRVIVVEANPVWTAAWVHLLYERKPPNMSYFFGAAHELTGLLRADVATIATHSDVKGMMSAGALLADETIDIYGELVASNPGAFDAWARTMREFV